MTFDDLTRLQKQEIEAAFIDFNLSEGCDHPDDQEMNRGCWNAAIIAVLLALEQP